MRRFIIPLIIVAAGAGWLASELTQIPSIEIVWTVGLLVGGLAAFMANGFSTASFVPGAFLLICSASSVLRWRGLLEWRYELPVLIMVFGVLLAVNKSGLIPVSKDE